MKNCSQCSLPKDLSEFDKKGLDKDGNQKYAAHCKECRKNYVNSHYENNKQEYKDKAVRNRDRYVREYNEYKESLHCTDCNISFKGEPYLCDFHHVDGNKDFNPSQLIESKGKFIKELEKCVPLCANCHRRRHHKKR